MISHLHGIEWGCLLRCRSHFFVTFRFNTHQRRTTTTKKMKLNATFAFILIWALDEITATENSTYNGLQTREEEQTMSTHSRRKRYIVFPKGSSLQLILEVLVHLPTQFRVVVGPTLQVAWPMPSEVLDKMKNFSKFSDAPTAPVNKFKLFSDLAALMDSLGTTLGLAWQLPDDPMIHLEFKKKHKIYKRNVFKKMEAFFQPAGADGRECVLKALCESGQRTPSKKEFLREILHKIFSVNVEEEDLEESEEDIAYRKAHQSANQNCESLYPRCEFSMFGAI